MAPLIGISCEVDSVTRYWGSAPHILIDQSYVDAVRSVGAVPVLLPVVATDEVPALLARLDGLVLTGGNDLGPGLYGEERLDVGIGGDVVPARDAFDLAIVHEVLRTALPTLAICRGLQAVNVALGGSLIQHLPDHPQSDQDIGGVTHDITVDRSSRFAGRFEIAKVNSYHHQSVGRLGEGVRVVATAPDDVVEAIEVVGAERLVAVQWHPEVLMDHADHRSLFEWLVSESSQR
jgi:putative glutamine amidotransferase